MDKEEMELDGKKKNEELGWGEEKSWKRSMTEKERKRRKREKKQKKEKNKRKEKREMERGRRQRKRKTQGQSKRRRSRKRRRRARNKTHLWKGAWSTTLNIFVTASWLQAAGSSS